MELENILMIALKAGAFLAGCVGIFLTVQAAVRTFVLPRPQNTWLSRFVFNTVYRLFSLSLQKATTYEERDARLAFFAPTVLVVTPLVYLFVLILFFTPIYWSIMDISLYQAFLLSGSSLLTLGYAGVTDLASMLVSFMDAALGLIVVALLIAYLPTIYAAFSAREQQVSMLEVRAGSPPSGVELISRVYRNSGDAKALLAVWERWEVWFSAIEENHTSLMALVFFRSPQPERHWVTAAGAVLDAASLLHSTVDVPRTVETALVIRAGFVALRRIADFFPEIQYDPDPAPTDLISISRDEFDQACEELRDGGVPLRADLDQAWRDFAGWRVNYDRVLIGLARLTSAPYAQWSSDRSLPDMNRIPG